MQPRSSLRRTIVSAAALLAAMSPAVAFAQTGPVPTGPLPDALGNTGNAGSGAAFAPQTPESILSNGGVLEFPVTTLGGQAVEVAGVQTGGTQTFVLNADHKPYWRIVPPSTDPEPQNQPVAVLGVVAIQGIALHGEGDLLLLRSGERLAVVRLPNDKLDASFIEPGWTVVAMGPPTRSGIMDTLQLAITPAP